MDKVLMALAGKRVSFFLQLQKPYKNEKVAFGEAVKVSQPNHIGF